MHAVMQLNLICKYDNNWIIKTGDDSEIDLHMLECDVYCVKEGKFLRNLFFSSLKAIKETALQNRCINVLYVVFREKRKAGI